MRMGWHLLRRELKPKRSGERQIRHSRLRDLRSGTESLKFGKSLSCDELVHGFAWRDIKLRKGFILKFWICTTGIEEKSI